MNFDIEEVNINAEGLAELSPYLLIAALFLFLLLLIVMYYEKFQQLFVLFLDIFRFAWRGIKFFKKLYTKFKTEGSVNNFLKKNVVKNVGYFLTKKVKIKWINPGSDIVSRADFIKRGKLILHLEESGCHEENFLNAAHFMISQSLVPNNRKYLSHNQKRAVDLYASQKFFEGQGAEIKSLFDDKFIEAYNSNRTISSLIDDFIAIDKQKLFFPILVQELHILTQKSITGDRSDIVGEVKDLIAFLVEHVDLREQKREAPLQFIGEYCSCDILIVGIQKKMETKGISPYKHALDICREKGIENVYIISDIDQKDFVSEVFLSVKRFWIMKNEYKYTILEKIGEETQRIKKNLLMLELKKGDQSGEDFERIQ